MIIKPKKSHIEVQIQLPTSYGLGACTLTSPILSKRLAMNPTPDQSLCTMIDTAIVRRKLNPSKVHGISCSHVPDQDLWVNDESLLGSEAVPDQDIWV